MKTLKDVHVQSEVLATSQFCQLFASISIINWAKSL